MESTRIYAQLREIYEASHGNLTHCMNLPADGMSIWEAGQIHEMVSKDLKAIYKRIKWLNSRIK